MNRQILSREANACYPLSRAVDVLNDRENGIMNCWEFKKCPPEICQSCPAHPKSGHECWKIPGTKCEGGALEYMDTREKMEYCFACGFYIHYAQKP